MKPKQGFPVTSCLHTHGPWSLRLGKHLCKRENGRAPGGGRRDVGMYWVHMYLRGTRGQDCPGSVSGGALVATYLGC